MHLAYTSEQRNTDQSLHRTRAPLTLRRHRRVNVWPMGFIKSSAFLYVSNVTGSRCDDGLEGSSTVLE